MKRYLRVVLFLSVASVGLPVVACEPEQLICQKSSKERFGLISQSQPVPVLIDANANSAIRLAAKNFADDLTAVSGNTASLHLALKGIAGPVVIIGEANKSPLINELVKAGRLDLSSLSGQWEAFKIERVKNPWPNVPEALVVVGADRRGAVFGAYTLSEHVGVSPWYWFADAPIRKINNAYVTGAGHFDKPAVKYRGIFINDEDPALSGWAKHLFGDVNANMYARVFELILRLKGNYIWPAMWGKSFHTDDPRNTALADSMGIVMGTSHHEPMTRAHAEWKGYMPEGSKKSAWNYSTNAKVLRQFWREGMERMMSKGDADGYESLVTIGMRGDGDEPMSEGTAITLLEKIVDDQRNIIEQVTQKKAEQVPQVWALYKEVQDYYDQGMQVPDDVTLLFADDNWGQIRRLPTTNVERAGGYGVYYHFDYVGAPRNYKWLNTNQVEKVWQQMDLAYTRGVKDLWVVNVGDIKPMEYPIDFFMRMAWAPETFTPKTLKVFPQEWAARVFGAKHAKSIGQLMTRYSQLAAKRKPEFLSDHAYKIGGVKEGYLIKGEFYEVLHRWESLKAAMLKTKKRLSKAQLNAYFQLIEFPILAMTNLHEMYFSSAWNIRLGSVYDGRANHFYTRAMNAYEYDQVLTDSYHTFNGGKWKGMMNQIHMNYVIWHDPVKQTPPNLVRLKGAPPNSDTHFVSAVNAQSRMIDIDVANMSKTTKTNDVGWHAIDNLGQAESALISYPQGIPTTTIEDGIAAVYDFKLKDTVDLNVAIRLNPTLNTHKNAPIKIGVSVDDGEVQELAMYLLPTSGRVNVPQNQFWLDAVTNNSEILNAKFKSVSKGKHKLKLWRLHDNVIVESIRLYW